MIIIIKDESYLYHQNKLFCFFVLFARSLIAALPLLPQLLKCNIHVAVMGSEFDQMGKVLRKADLISCGNPSPT